MTTPRRMAHEITDIGRALGSQILRRVGRAAARYHERTALPVDVLESEAQYLVVFDAPGVETSDIQVGYDDRAVEVRIDRFRKFREGYDMVFPGRGMALDGRAELPGDTPVDASGARAELRDDGTLNVFVPKVDVGAGVATDAESDAESATDSDTGPDADTA